MESYAWCHTQLSRRDYRQKFSVWRGAISFLSGGAPPQLAVNMYLWSLAHPSSLQIPEKREASDRERPFWDTASRDWPSQPSERQKLTLSTTITTGTNIFNTPQSCVSVSQADTLYSILHRYRTCASHAVTQLQTVMNTHTAVLRSAVTHKHISKRISGTKYMHT